MSTIGLPALFLQRRNQTGTAAPKPRRRVSVPAASSPAVALPPDMPASMPPIDQAAASLARSTNGVVVDLAPDDLEPIALWLSSDQSEDCEIPF